MRTDHDPTTSRRALLDVKPRDSDVATWPQRARWIEDGKHLTTAGVSAGIDGGLYLAQRLAGEEAAKLIKRGLEYEPDPPLGPIDWDPAVVEAVRPIWREPLVDLIAAHPYLNSKAPRRA